jgi:hypothetical protein
MDRRWCHTDGEEPKLSTVLFFTGTRRTLKPGSLWIMEDAMGCDGPGGTR